MLRKPRPWEWCVAIGIVACILGVFVPIGACACGTPKGICASKAKTQFRLLVMYAADWDDRLPNRDRWMDAIEPLASTKGASREPTITGAGQYGYSFDSRLSERIQTEVADPAKHPMIFDSINLGRNASDPFTSLPKPGRHDGRNNLTYLDGHVKSIKN